MSDAKYVIFDWGGTLWDNASDQLFPDAQEVLEYLKQKGYRIALLTRIQPKSGVWHETIEGRQKRVKDSSLYPYFEKIVVSTKKGQEEIDAIQSVWRNVPYENIISVGDRASVDVWLANKLGMRSLWVCQGRYAEELPDDQTGQPTYTVRSLKEIKGLL